MKTRVLFMSTITFSLLILFNACGEHKARGQRTIEKVDGVTVVKNPLEPLNP
jgi:hypothetical protein